MMRVSLSLSLFLLFFSPVSGADNKGGPEVFKRLKFRLIGPAAGGRVCRAAGVPGDTLTYYAATAASGLWKTTDGGLTWKPIMDDQPTSTIGSLAIAPSDSNVLYVGSGEANIRGNVEVGNGIYKSTDAGKTWKHVWKQEGQIGTMIVHPKDPDIAFAAVLGKAFGPNAERGVYRTTDGGKTWKRVLFKNNDTGASDVAFDPSNPRIIFAGLWQARRKPWEMTSGGPGSGLHVSRDGGDTWTQLVAEPKADSPEADKKAEKGTKRCKGLPEGIWGKIGLAIAPSNAKRIYALIEAEKGGLFRSDDGGDTWTRINESRALRQRAWYFSTLTVDPKNADVVWFPQVPLLKTIDGGKTLLRVKGPHHGDHHDLWIDPKNPNRMIDSNDGGVDISTNGGKSWYAPPLPICQFYHISVDNRVPYHVSGTMQDMGTAQGPSRSLVGSGIPLSAWYPVGGGETGFTVSDPDDPNIVFAGEYGGYLTRYDHRTRQAKSIGAFPYNPSGHGAEQLKYRFQWTAPLMLSVHDKKTLYHGANALFSTSDSGLTWKALSKDLTRNDKSKQKWSGGPITGDNTGVEVYGTLFALAESPKQKGVLWTGSDDGLVHVSKDAGKTWSNVTAGLTKIGLPEWGTVVCIEPSPRDAGTAYVVVDAHKNDDRKPYLFVTRDFGKTWKSLTSKMPEDGYLNVVRIDPTNLSLLYVGTERGVIFSRDDGQTWDRLKLNLPTVRVTDIKVKNDDLVIGTNGRSIWILDDITALRLWDKEIEKKALHLFAPPTALRIRPGGTVAEGAPTGMFPNPAPGAMITYSLGKRPKGDITLTIADSKGKVIRTLSSKAKEKKEKQDEGSYSEDGFKETLLPVEPGLHRITWDLRHDGAKAIFQARTDSGQPRAGPLALPGTYTLTLTAEGKSVTAKVEVKLDPRQKIAKTASVKDRRGTLNPGELEAQLTLALQLRDDITALSTAVEELRSVRKQLTEREALLKENEEAKELLKASKAVLKKLDERESEMHNPKAKVSYDILAQKGGAKLYSQLTWLFELIKDSDGAPTQGIKEQASEQQKVLVKQLASWKKLVQGDLTKLNTQAKKLDVPGIVLPKVAKK